VPELERVIETLQSGSSRDARDRAMLLLGFACGYRSSDLVALDVEDIRFEGAGMYVILARSKEDLLARGRTTNVPAATNANLCPVRAMGRWLEVAALQTGPLFRMIQGSQIGASRMHPRAVSRALQRGVKRAGLTGAYSSHSLRAGLAAAADARGHSQRAIQEHVGWLDARTPSRYIDTNKAKRSSSVLHGLL
jgi:integrase